MIAFTVDIADIRFWFSALVAILLLNLFSESRWRMLVWAAVNVGFLAVLLDVAVLTVLLGVGLIHFGLAVLAGDRPRGVVLVPAALATLGLFLVHKLPLRGFTFQSLVWPLEPFMTWPAGLAMLIFLGWGFRSRRFRMASGAIACVLAFVLIMTALIRLFPSAVGESTFDSARRVLSGIGFSYVALRLLEVHRAVSEGRHRSPSFPALVNYLLPFHMLGAGPIQGYDEFASQPPTAPALQPIEQLRAVERITFGLFKKYVLAASIQAVFLTGFETPGFYRFIEMQLFFLWIYLDFSAYTDIAVGLGRLMGVATPENFNRPYLARNMIDFWERWHISLSHFIQRNIYIPIFATLMRSERPLHPLAGSTVAFTISFILCGLWHDVSMNFLLWGALHAFGLVVTNLYQFALRQRLGAGGMKTYRKNRAIRVGAIVLTYEFVAFSMWTIFIPL